MCEIKILSRRAFTLERYPVLQKVLKKFKNFKISLTEARNVTEMANNYGKPCLNYFFSTIYYQIPFKDFQPVTSLGVNPKTEDS